MQLALDVGSCYSACKQLSKPSGIVADKEIICEGGDAPRPLCDRYFEDLCPCCVAPDESLIGWHHSETQNCNSGFSLAVHLLYIFNDDIQQVSMSTKCLTSSDCALTYCGELLLYWLPSWKSPPPWSWFRSSCWFILCHYVYLVLVLLPWLLLIYAVCAPQYWENNVRTALWQSTNHDQSCPNISVQSNRGRVSVVRKASMNCSYKRDIASHLYGYIRDLKVISSIACGREDAINHSSGASIAPPGTDRSKFVQPINARQVPYKWGTML
jgi:hypothetical protein